MDIYQFMSDSPYVASFLGILVMLIIRCLFFQLPNRYFRSKNIAAHGWPPEHCDADGDFKSKSDE